MILDELIADLDKQEVDCAERGLFCAIINAAIIDARTGDIMTCLKTREAMDFLFSHRIDPYLELLGYDPDGFKWKLVRTQNQECVTPEWVKTDKAMDRMRNLENKARRIFRRNHSIYLEQGQPFQSMVPPSMLYAGKHKSNIGVRYA